MIVAVNVDVKRTGVNIAKVRLELLVNWEFGCDFW
jgi:hypothetical protein